MAELAKQSDDDFIFELARRKGAVLITYDKDFGDMIFRRKLLKSGVLLLRLDSVSANEKAILVESAVADHWEELGRSFPVLSRTILRVQPYNAT